MKKNKAQRLAAKAAATQKEEITKAEVEVKAPKKVNKKQVDNLNATNVVAKITEKKDLKYKYPDYCQEGEDKQELLELRKKFRAGVRRTLKSFDNAILKLQKSGLEEDLVLMGKKERERAKYRKEVLVNP